MILYRIVATGLFVPTKPTGKVEFEQINLSEIKGRAGMADFLNGLVGTKAVVVEPEAEEVVEFAIGRSTYTSPLCARTTIAGIDSNMIASAIRQFDGPNLSRVMSAGIDRLAELSRELPA